MTRTSQTQPLQISVVHPGPGLGQIGITFCPGKHQLASATGSWARDLTINIRALADWGAAAVLTLVKGQRPLSRIVISWDCADSITPTVIS